MLFLINLDLRVSLVEQGLRLFYEHDYTCMLQYVYKNILQYL